MYEIKIGGLSKLEEKLCDIGTKKAINILVNSGKEALLPVLNDMKKNAGFDENNKNEHMKDSIKIRKRSVKKRVSVVSFSVGPTKKHRMKALVQEFGSIKQSPKPFIRPSLDYNKIKVLSILKNNIKHRIKNLK